MKLTRPPGRLDLSLRVPPLPTRNVPVSAVRSAAGMFRRGWRPARRASGRAGGCWTTGASAEKTPSIRRSVTLVCLSDGTKMWIITEADPTRELVASSITPRMSSRNLVVMPDLDLQRPHHRCHPQSWRQRRRIPVELHFHAALTIDHQRIQNL